MMKDYPITEWLKEAYGDAVKASVEEMFAVEQRAKCRVGLHSDKKPGRDTHRQPGVCWLCGASI